MTNEELERARPHGSGPLTKEEFEYVYAKRVKVSGNKFRHANPVTVPCTCGQVGCSGWKVVYEPCKNCGHARGQHGYLAIPDGKCLGDGQPCSCEGYVPMSES